MRIKISAAPIAISMLYQDHKHDYRGWKSTAMRFQEEGPLTDKLLSKQINAPVDRSQGHYYWIGDDRGFADYMIAAFALFGPRVKSLYYFWFVILLLSVTLFISSFRKETWAIAFLALVILGIHSAAAFLKFLYGTMPIFEPRFLDVLALIAVCHIMLASIFFKKNDLKTQLWPLSGQLLIFIFLLHARSTLFWEVIAITGISLFAIVMKRKWNGLSFPTLVIGLLLFAMTGLVGYKQCVYHKKYLKSLNVRIFWHNALMGIVKKSSAPGDYLIDDHAIAQLVIEHAKDSNTCASCLKKLSSQELLNSLGNHGTVDWVAYENCAKKLFFSIFKQNKWEIIRAYLFDKPLRTISHLPPFQYKSLNFGEFYSAASKIQGAKILPFNPFNLMYLLPFCIVLILGIESLYFYRQKLLAITLALFITSLILPVIFYESNLNFGGLSAIIPMLLYLGVAICTYKTYQLLKKFRTLSVKNRNVAEEN